ncbi:MAG: hypothetical protein KGL01_00475, partial [Betaproteobacteria bacterium]|nr:hypothetical protein [Betaproteobacteria bacterium]
MSNIQDMFEQAQLAEAAYADLTTAIGNQNTLKDVLNIANKSQYNGSFSTAQAAEFVKHWRVVNQYTASGGLLGQGSGFSATVFESIDNPGQYSLAMRGTAGATDLLADAGDVLADGIALDQVVDMYNYWQSLNTSGIYQAAKLETSLMETAALNLLLPGAARDAAIAALKASGAILDSTLGGLTIEVRRIVKGDSNILLVDTPLATGSGTFAVCPANLNVDGHSLGGHLAMAFSRLFPTAVSSVTAVNGAGFNFANSNVNALFTALAGAPGFDANKITNIVGSAAMNVVSQDWLFLQQPAGRNEIYTESAFLENTLGHGAGQMTDSLAVYNLL